MKFLDKIIVNNDFYENAKGRVIDKRHRESFSKIYDGKTIEYLIEFDWSNYNNWIHENDVFKVES